MQRMGHSAVRAAMTVTLASQRQYILAAIEHTSRCVRILGTTVHPTATG
jgi:putative transposase